MQTTGTYNKGNSILEMRGIDKNRDKVMEKILPYFPMTADLDSDDPLRKALLELFDPEESVNTNDPSHFFLRDHVIEEMLRLDDDEIPRYLRYRYSYDIYPVEKIVKEFPPLIQIEPASICNYRCVFCFQKDQRLTKKANGHMGMMKLELFKNIIDQLEGNIEGITLASRGEPTINKQFPEMLQYMSGKFLSVKVNTNAFFLDERMAHSILETGIQTLVFSADAASEPLYSQLRVNGNLKRVTKNIEKFHSIKEKNYPTSRLITRVSGVQFNKDQNLDDMESFWSNLVDQVVFVDYNPWENVYDSKKNSIVSPCSDLWRRMFIWWDGRVCPCDVDYLTKLIDERVQLKRISKIWQGEEYSELRERHMLKERHLLEPCSRCVVI